MSKRAPALQTRRQPSFIAQWIRRLSIPIVLGWVAVLFVLNAAVPQLEEVAAQNQVSMSPKNAPSMQAMATMGRLFEESDSDAIAMLVLEGDQPLGEDAHDYYDGLIDKLRADSEHIQHIQDFWGDPLTEAGAQSNDGKAAYVQLNLAGNMGETLSNESVEAVRTIVGESPPPPGVKVFVTGPAALQADMTHAGDSTLVKITIVTFVVIITMLLFFYRSIVTVVLLLLMVGIQLTAARGIVALLGYHHIIGLSTFATNMLVSLTIAAGTDYAIFLIGRYQEARASGATREEAYYEMFHGTAHVVLGSGLTIAGATVLPHLHAHAVLPDARSALRGRHSRRCCGGADAGPGDHHHRQSFRPLRTKALDADPLLAADRDHDRAVARPDSHRVVGAGPHRPRRPARIQGELRRHEIHPREHPGQRGIRGGEPAFLHGPDESGGLADRGRSRPSQLVGLPRHRQDRQGGVPRTWNRQGPGDHPAGRHANPAHVAAVPHEHAGRRPDAEHEADEGPHGRHEDPGRGDGQDRRDHEAHVRADDRSWSASHTTWSARWTICR